MIQENVTESRLQYLLGKTVLFKTLTGRMRGVVRIPAKDHDFLVVTPAGSMHSDVIHYTDVISILS